MKKKILYLILLLCAVAMPLGVRADTDYSISGNDVGGGGGGGNSTDGTKGYVVPQYVGVRVTLVDATGKRVSNETVNFFTANYRSYEDGTCYTINSNKIDISKNGGIPTVYCNKMIIGGEYEGKGKTMHNLHESYVAVDPYGVVSTLQNLKFGNVANSFVELAKIEANVKKFLSAYFVKYDEYNAKDWYLMVEPLITYKIKGEEYPYVIGTPTELTKIIYKKSYTCGGTTGCLNVYNGKTDWGYVYKNYIYFTKSCYGDCTNQKNVYSNFSALSPVSKNSPADVGVDNVLGTNGYNVGLIWLGMYAKEKSYTCSSVTIDSSAPIDSKFTYYSVSSISGFASWNGASKYSGGYYKKDEGYNPNYYINAVCYDAPISTTCSKEATNASKFPLSNGGLSIATKDNYDSSKYIGYYNSGAGYDPNFYVNSVCYDAPTTTTCSAAVTNASKFPLSNNLKNKEISTKEQYGKDNYYNPDVGYHPNYYVNSICYERPTCSDFYYNTRNFNKVSLWSGAETNCCIQYEGNSGTDLNRLYRDHPECYSCKYSELSSTPTCSSSNNTGVVGDSFSSVGNGNTQTCAYYVASGRVNSTSSNLVTRKTINSYCKVVCTETVNVKFPLFNHNYIQQGSYIVWPTNLVFKDESSRLVLHGTANCWYYVDSVGLDQLGRSNKGMADTYLKQCATDFKNSYDNPTNVINYNLEGNFSVKYNDSEYGKNINLVKENDEEASYKRKNNLSSMNAINNANGGYSRANLNNFVKAVEGITFEVTQTANYVIDSSSGYNYSYNGKWYSTYDEKWGNNTVKLEYAALGLKNDLYKGGKLEIDYSSIGGGGKKYSTTQKTYGTCEYCTVSAPLKECPAGTKNAGMNLTQIMEMESLSHEEAISKYCDSSLTVCPSGTYYAGSAVTEACLKDDNCRELTCNLYACTINDECKVLNYCISDQVEKYGKSFDEAKRYCENAYCGPGDNISDSIEYRVIDLKNPFPGVSAKFGVSIFNTNIAGRKPGQNWNSLNLVKKEILNNRGVSGDKVYSLEPLFEFNLTPSVIQRIRSYNDKNSYDDFTLKCKQNDKYACVASGFNIRSEDYGNVRTLSACQNISNLTNFNSCYNS